MFRNTRVIALLAGVIVAASSFAQAPAAAPAGSTGLCRDGSYSSSAAKKGACRGHKGVQEWYAATPDAPAAAPAASAAAPAAPAAPVAPAASAAMPAPAPAATTEPSKPAVVAAPGGGAGQVWVNSSSKVYHCSTDRWYGKTKHGAYMTEADAIAQGNRADHGKACK